VHSLPAAAVEGGAPDGDGIVRGEAREVDAGAVDGRFEIERSSVEGYLLDAVVDEVKERRRAGLGAGEGHSGFAGEPRGGRVPGSAEVKVHRVAFDPNNE
jgi:hypothetical protein